MEARRVAAQTMGTDCLVRLRFEYEMRDEVPLELLNVICCFGLAKVLPSQLRPRIQIQ